MVQRLANFTNPKPLLIYDGECRFCQYCIDYLQAQTGDRVIFAHYQRVANNYPDISLQRFEEAIQLISVDGYVYEGAEAVFRVLKLGADRTVGLMLYRYLPGFSVLSRSLYRGISKHRALTHNLCRLLFGNELRPLSYQSLSRLFIRLLALIYLVAFVSLLWQAKGLFGLEGILPIADYFAAIDAAGYEKYLRTPSLLWLSRSDGMLQALPLAGVLLSLLLLTLKFPRACLLLLYLLYLSLVNAGQQFMQYQWDLLLLEAGFLAFILCLWPGLGVWLFRWLLFRFMWLAGWVKIASDDPLWVNWNALSVHFETQPLPTFLAWYADQLPAILLRIGTAFTLIIELVVPFLIFMPRNLRLLAFLCFALLQGAIIITGNYNFFNLLTLALCLFLLDDARLDSWFGGAFSRTREDVPSAPGLIRRWSGVAIAGFVFTVSVSQLYLILGGREPTGWQLKMQQQIEPWHIINPYGVFAVMTRERREIIIEGSLDGTNWEPYYTRFKPDRLDRRPTWATPHQPRLDWQLWFAAMRDHPPAWLENCLAGLLLGSAPIQSLFEEAPFAGEPPGFVRASLYEYRFTTGEERSETGHWWKRAYVGEAVSPMSLVAAQPASDELMTIPPARE